MSTIVLGVDIKEDWEWVTYGGVGAILHEIGSCVLAYSILLNTIVLWQLGH